MDPRIPGRACFQKTIGTLVFYMVLMVHLSFLQMMI